MTALLKKITSVYLIKLLMVGLGFLAMLVITRNYGAEQAGEYFWLLSVTAGGCVLLRLGQENTLVKQISQADNPSQKNNLLSAALLNTLLVSVFYSVAIMFFSLFIQIEYSLYMAIITVPILFAVISLIGYALQAEGKVNSQQLLLNTPRLLVALIAAFIIWYNASLFPLNYLLVCAFLIVLLAALIIMFKANLRLKSIMPSLLASKSDCINFYAVSISAVIMAEGANIILGLLASKQDVAYFSVALRITSLLAFVLLAFNSVVTPQFAKLVSQQNNIGLVRLYQNCRRQSFLVASSIGLILCLLSPVVLPFFGDDFSNALPIVLILVLAQLIKVAVGSAGQLLMMSGHVKLQRFCLLIGVSVLIVFCLLLIPYFGAMGAALSALLSVMLNNLLTLYYVNKHLSIPIGFTTTLVKHNA